MALPITIPNTFANATSSIPLSQLDNNFSTVVVAINGIGNGAEALANVNITGGTVANVNVTSGNVTVTTVDATNLEVTNVKSKNGANAFVITDTTGNVNFDSNTLVVDASNNRVGVGTATPGAKVQILSSTNDGLSVTDGTVTTVMYCSTGPQATVGTTSNHPLQFYTNNASRMSISTSGAVSAAGNVSITAATTEERFLRIGDGRTGNGYSYIDLVGDSTYSNGLRIIRLNTGPNAGSSIESRGTGAFQLVTQEAAPLVFYTNGANERLRLTSDGYARLASGTGGIQFNGDTAAANALDDYEEGTWTPTLAFGGGSSGITYAQQNGFYTKVGNIVHFVAVIQITAKGVSTGNATIPNLPITAQTSYKEEPHALLIYNLTTSIASAVAYTQGGQIVLCKIATTATGNVNNFVDGDFSNSTVLHVAGVYRAA